MQNVNCEDTQNGGIMNNKWKNVVRTVMAVLCFAFLAGFTGVKASAEVVPGEITYQNSQPTPGVEEITLGAYDGASNVTEIKMNYAGVLQIGVSTTGLADSVRCYLYSDAACTQEVGNYMYLSSSSLTDVQNFKITAAGTYYLKSVYGYYSSGVENHFNLLAVAYNGQAKKLSKDYKLTYTDDYNKTLYHKLTVKNTQVITLTGAAINSYGTSPLSVKLCNKKKHVMKNMYLYSSNDYTGHFVVKKGTYYISVQENSPYILKAETKKVKNNAGASKKKAKLIKKGKTMSGYLTQTDSSNKQCWYKIKLSKSMKLKISVNSRVSLNDSVKLAVVPADSRMYITNSTAYLKSGTQTFTSKNKFKKGTYYIVVQKSTSGGSASFSIKNISK